MKVKFTYFYLNDFIIVTSCLVFSAASFCTIGNANITFRSFVIDRQLVAALGFLMLIAGCFFFYHTSNQRPSKIIRLLRLFYIQCFYPLFFSESILLSQFIYKNGCFDHIFLHLDEILFGIQPSVHFFQSIHAGTYIIELFFLSYFSFYIIISLSFLPLYIKGKETKVQKAITIISFAFYLLYIFYIFFPVKGPKYFIPELYELGYSHFQGFLVTEIMEKLLTGMNLAGAAFPSSHIAVSFIALYFLFSFQPKIGAALFPLALLLTISTVFLYAHYFVDIWGGLITGAFFVLILPNIIKSLEKTFIRLDSFMGERLCLKPLYSGEEQGLRNNPQVESDPTL